MVRMARCEVVDPAEVAICHVYSRVTRRCFLLGDDPVSGKNFDHRKAWIEDYLRQFAACFGIDLIGFAILSNHFHLILRTRPDVVATWSDEEVARRWLMLCPHRRNADGTPAKPSEPEINSIAGCPVRRAEIRSRLSNVSWWMRLLCQRVATRANREDNETGRFFQDRYKLTRLIDEASLLACAAYVDLNVIRAAIAETLESSEHTSIQRRTQSAVQAEAAESVADAEIESSPPDAMLAPVTLDERDGPIGPCESKRPDRCSDKGFLPMSREDYFELLDWTARQSVAGKRGKTPASVVGVLQRLGLAQDDWCELTSDFSKLFGNVAGRCERVDELRSHQTHRRYHLRRRARELMTSR